MVEIDTMAIMELNFEFNQGICGGFPLFNGKPFIKNGKWYLMLTYSK